MMNTVEFTDRNFQEVVLEAPLPVLVDFWASWCPPCKAIEPVIKKLEKEFQGSMLIGRINVDRNPVTAERHKVLGLPTFIIFWQGMEISREIASLSENQLKSFINKAFKQIN